MSLITREVSPKKLAANQSNAQKSTGPRTAEGKARVALNALRTGAYAKGANAVRQLLLKRGEDPQDREKLQQDLMESWQPDDTMQAIMVQVLADKTWDMFQLRADRRHLELVAYEMGQIEAQRRQLYSRRWRPGAPAVPSHEIPPLWLAKDRPHKFRVIFEILDDLQKWYDDRLIPEEFVEEMNTLYGEHHSVAGERIRNLFIAMFEDDQDAAAKAEAELPKWIAQERRDVEQEQELYRRESQLRSQLPKLTDEQIAVKEALLQKQIADQTRLLLQLKSKRSLWPAQFEMLETGEAGKSAEAGARSGSDGADAAQKQNKQNGEPSPDGGSLGGPEGASEGGKTNLAPAAP